MRVAIIDLGYHFPSTVGSITHTHGVAEMLQRNGCDVHLFGLEMPDCFPRGKVTADPGYPVTLVSMRRENFTPWLVQKQFRSVIDAHSPDLVYLGEGWTMKNWIADALASDYPCLLRFYAYEMLCPYATLFSHQLGGRFCENDTLADSDRCQACFDHAYPPEQQVELVLSQKSLTALETLAGRFFSDDYRTTLHRVLQSVYCCLPQNRFLANRLQELGARTRIIPPGIDVDRWPYRWPEHREVVRFFAPGRMDADYKGLPLIQRAARQLWEHRQDFVIQVTMEQVGTLSPGVESIGLHPHSAMSELYADSDVVLALSAHPEPLPYVGIEAFCSARPVIGTRIGGMLDLIGDSSGGWLVDVEQEDELCRIMERLIDRPDERHAAGRAAHLRAKRTYDWQVLFDRQYAPLLQGLNMPAMRV